MHCTPTSLFNRRNTRTKENIICFIGGFSLAEGSKINARALSNALLSEGEIRGTHAAGYAYATRAGLSGMHKDHVPGSQLELKGMPRKADTVILHTRYATHGPAEDNANNHPLPSMDKRITLVHNGVLYNHDLIRTVLTNGGDLPLVDSSVAAEMLSEYGTDGFGLIAGDAAFGWIDTQTSNTLHLAKLNHSPVSMARLLDGSFVFASTDAILAKALKRLDLKWVGNYPKTFAELTEGDYIQITDSKATMMDKLDWDYETRRYGGGNWRNATSGGHGTTTTTTSRHTVVGGAQKSSYTPPAPVASRVPTQKALPVGSEVTAPITPTVPATGPISPSGGWMVNASDADKAWYEQWMEEKDEGWFDEDGMWRGDTQPEFTGSDNATSESMLMGGSFEDRFYVIDHDGDYQGLTNPQGLAAMLHWRAENDKGADMISEGEARWVNHFRDVGEVLADGSLSSWLTDPVASEDFDKEVVGGFAFVRTGISVLQNISV